ncbi:cubilin-like [Haliotis rubra]|uniref:cubilin-like n=1 Tax=Haliotis rubra TaxID=36100 RepID=UPI001EE6166E|nr:cubilin-like [Haliotis rubra]
MSLYTGEVVLVAVLLLHRATNTDACGKDIQLSNVTKSIKLMSPRYPSLYNSALSCGWRISASSPNHLVGVSYVAQFESNNCQHGSLSFYDGSDNSSGLLLQLCETDRGGILSSGYTMYIQFTSSASSNGTSFVLTANNTERCGGTFIATSQITNFTVPGAPYVSYRNLNCKWIITAENENDTVQVKSDMQVYYFGSASESCKYDVVRVYNGNTTEADQFLGEYCSTQMPNFYSSKKSLLLVLTTDGNKTSIGLQMQYSSRPEGNCNRTHTIYNTPIYILSPGYPNSYDSNLTCNILLFVTMHPRNMRLDVLTADMAGTYPECDTDSVRLIAGTGRYYLAGEFCGNSSLSPIGPYYSNGIFMKLLFQSSSDTSGKVFRLKVSHTSRKVIPHQSENCGPQFRNATAHPKILSSPGYPVISPNQDFCIWKVMASDPKMMVRIVVIDSDAPNFEYGIRSCGYRVTFYNGPSIFNDTIFSWCGDSKPNLQTTGSAMTIEFQTRFSNSLKGFRLKYFATNETYRCGGTVNITEVGSRTLTGPYQNSQDCHWTIHVPASMNIKVKVTNLNPYIIPMATCNADYVEIYNGIFDNTSSTSKWCGQYSDDFISSGHTITVRFHSGIDNTHRGIRLIFKAGHLSASRMTSLSANYTDKYIASPNYPFYYPSNIERTWKMDAGEYNRVKLKVIYSQLESSVGCQNDYVEAFDGSDSKATSLGRWCGGTRPNKTSSGSLMFLKFKSNSHVVDKGFIIRYTAEYMGINDSTDLTWPIVGVSMGVVGAIIGAISGIKVRRCYQKKT